VKRPFFHRLLPDRFKEASYYRFYHRNFESWRDLYTEAPLAFASGISMFNLLPGDVISGNIAFNGFYELDLTRRIVRLAKAGKILVDVGANMGYFSLLWAGVNPLGKVIAYEAARRNILLLNNNLIENRMSDRINVVSKAVADRTGIIDFDEGPPDQTGWGGISTKPSSRTCSVPLVRLDNELGDSFIDVLKIDVEGADTLVLFGCEELLKKKRIGVILFEENVERMSALNIAKNEAQRYLRAFNYTCSQIGSGQWMGYPM
jgi:FkbM family methyltransferase